MILRNLLVSVAALFVAGALPALAAGPSKCKLVRIAEWPVRFVGNQPVVEGSINGASMGVLLDTGAYASLITKAAADKLDLPMQLTGERMSGFGGDSRVYMARLAELRIGGAVRKGMRVRVSGERPIPGVDFILGEDFFKGADVEFDYAKGMVRLFEPLDCADVSLAYWDANALQLPLENEIHVIVPIVVNGREARAMLDSGASSSVVDLGFAAKVGITPATPGVLSSYCSHGIGAANVHAWVARFDTVTLGAETVRDPRLRIADFNSQLSSGQGPPPEVILGTDFLRAHRVLISRSQGKVYFSYGGGQIFPASPAVDCDDRLADKSPAEALAAYDEAIAQNPNDTRARLNRAILRRRNNDAKGGLADLDAVIALEPANPIAHDLRSAARAAAGDYEGALADADATIANGVRTAWMYVGRARLHTVRGDPARALEDYGEALQLDPRLAAALRERGHLLFDAGRFDAAEGDFEKLSALAAADAYDALWLSLSRMRRGADGHAALEQGIARLKEREWPEPVMMYLLGRIDRAALMAAAAASDAKKRQGNECEARFYVAERLMGEGRRDEARPLLESAAAECPRGFVEQHAAVAELKKLQ